VQCWLNLATGKLKLGKYQACIKACDEAAVLDSKYARTYRIRAEAHIGRKDFDSARWDLQKSLALEPNPETAVLLTQLNKGKGAESEQAESEQAAEPQEEISQVASAEDSSRDSGIEQGSENPQQNDSQKELDKVQAEIEQTKQEIQRLMMVKQITMQQNAKRSKKNHTSISLFCLMFVVALYHWFYSTEDS